MLNKEQKIKGAKMAQEFVDAMNSWGKKDELTLKAEDLVKDRIKGTRKGLPDAPNYMHSFRVRDLIQNSIEGTDHDSELYIAALLHDVIEDGDVTFKELKSIGFSDRTIDLVDLCSHDLSIEDTTQKWITMIARLVNANDDDAWRIKLADLADNLTQCSGLSQENRKFMIEVKAPLMLRLGSVSYSVSSKLKAEMEKQRGLLEVGNRSHNYD